MGPRDGRSGRAARQWAGPFLLLVATTVPVPRNVQAQWQASLSVGGSAFGGTPAPGASALSPVESGLALDASFSRDWAGGRYAFRAAPFVRWDPAGVRSRVDLGDLYLGALGERWELRVGMAEVSWGTVESRRLVDGVNQRDLVGGREDYRRLGQLMADVTAIRSWGTVDLLILPWFRERTFDGHAGLLWSPRPVDAARAVYGPGAGPWRLDWALRWRHTLGAVDVAVSHLQGNLREPGFVEVAGAGPGGTVLAPRYDVGGQTGLELQVAAAGLVWKLEALTADPEAGRYVAAVGGIELAIADYLALFLEYDWDSRGPAATTSFGDDFFIGGRAFLPVGQLRAGAHVDRRTLNTVAAVGVHWRLGDATSLGLDIGAFFGDASAEPRLGRRQQTSISLRLSRYF